MSRFAAWDASGWFWAVASGLMILLGLICLLRLRSPRVEDRASGWELRYGQGADLGRRRMPDDLARGILLIAFGALQLFRYNRAIGSVAWLLGPFLIAFGFWILIFEQRFELWRLRRYRVRLDARLASGEDSYFEELRALRAHPPRRTSGTSSRLEAILILLCGGSFLASAITR